MRRGALCRAGFTFPEMLTSLVVFGLIIGTISGIYMSSLRSWALGITENYSQQKASWAIARMAPDIRLGIRVTPGNAPFQSSYLAIHLPHRVYDSGLQAHLNEVTLKTDPATGASIPCLTEDTIAVYYRGDAAGNMALDGDRLWRKLLASDGATELRSDVLADHVVDNPPDASGHPRPLFVYWPDQWRLNSVQMTITVRERQGNRTSTATMTGEFALRNHA